MTYPEFYNVFKDYFTGSQIAKIQQIAFKEYTYGHGYYPLRKEQKQLAYSFVYDLIYNDIIDAEDCYEYLKSAGVSKETVEAFWKSLDY